MVGPDWQFDAQLVRIGRFLVVLGQAFTNLPCGDAHHGIHCGIVIRVPAEDIDGKSRGVADDVIARNLQSVHNGDRVDLGDRSLVIYDAPGHTPGSIVIFDEKTGNLFTGDSFGSNSPTIPDAFWLQFTQVPLDTYLATVKTSRTYFRGKVTHLMTGHNDHPLGGKSTSITCNRPCNL